jgi:hypothetical protein
MKRFFYFLIIVLCFSCKEKENIKTEQIQIPEPNEMEIVETTLIPAKCAIDNFIMVDSLLLMTTYCDSMCFSVYNKFTHEFVISFGNKGNRQFDISFPLLYKQENYDAEKILAYDSDLCRNITINLDSIVKGYNPYSQIKFTRQDKELWWTGELSHINENKIVGSNMASFSGDGMFFIYNTQTKEKQWIDFNPKYEYDINDYLRFVYDNVIATSKNRQSIAVAFRSIDMICLYDFDGSCKKRICFSELKKPVVDKKRKIIDEDEKLYFFRIFGTEKYFYAVRGNISTADILNGINYQPDILKFNWDGELIDNYSFKKPINAICIDEDRMRLYIVTSTDNPEYEELIEFKL